MGSLLLRDLERPRPPRGHICVSEGDEEAWGPLGIEDQLPKHSQRQSPTAPSWGATYLGRTMPTELHTAGRIPSPHQVISQSLKFHLSSDVNGTNRRGGRAHFVSAAEEAAVSPCRGDIGKSGLLLQRQSQVCREGQQCTVSPGPQQCELESGLRQEQSPALHGSRGRVGQGNGQALKTKQSRKQRPGTGGSWKLGLQRCAEPQRT